MLLMNLHLLHPHLITTSSALKPKSGFNVRFRNAFKQSLSLKKSVLSFPSKHIENPKATSAPQQAENSIQHVFFMRLFIPLSFSCHGQNCCRLSVYHFSESCRFNMSLTLFNSFHVLIFHVCLMRSILLIAHGCRINTNLLTRQPQDTAIHPFIISFIMHSALYNNSLL